MENWDTDLKGKRKREEQPNLKKNKNKINAQEGWERRKLRSHFLNDPWNRIKLGDNFGNKSQ